MKNISTKEHLLHFMHSGFMRLSKYDLKFVENILNILTHKKEITSNQVNLFLKLLSKYKRQLDKHNFTAEVIDSLPWTVTIKQSDPYFTNAFISIVNDSIYFRSPFNKNFIKSFKQIPNNVFKWNNIEKRYEAPFSVNSLKILITGSSEFYPVINYCSITANLLNTLLPYENASVWSPTLCKVNGNFLIGASNLALDQAIGHIVLSDDALTLSELACYGIKVAESITNNDDTLLFASKYIVSMDFLETEKLTQLLHLIKCDLVLLDGVGMGHYYKNILSAKLIENNFRVVDLSNKETGIKTESVKSVLIKFTKYGSPVKNNPYKIIEMTNSTPVNVK